MTYILITISVLTYFLLIHLAHYDVFTKQVGKICIKGITEEVYALLDKLNQSKKDSKEKEVIHDLLTNYHMDENFTQRISSMLISAILMDSLILLASISLLTFYYQYLDISKDILAIVIVAYTISISVYICYICKYTYGHINDMKSFMGKLQQMIFDMKVNETEVDLFIKKQIAYYAPRYRAKMERFGKKYYWMITLTPFIVPSLCAILVSLR